MKSIILTLFSIFSFCLCICAQTISGKVISSRNGEALIGVSVRQKNTTNFTFADIDGSFKIKIDTINKTLQFSDIGYDNQEITFEKDSFVNVVLDEELLYLDEIKVFAFATYIPVKKLIVDETDKISTAKDSIFAKPVVRKRWDKDEYFYFDLPNIKNWLKNFVDSIIYPDTAIR
ncbi:MAG: carboxypeptidase-like regulatory domain-containing protein, partial [Paludibacter sp.]|nr:carboxypeptidase-like regulatory domain-containing protein [Paludibacter sp.]